MEQIMCGMLARSKAGHDAKLRMNFIRILPVRNSNQNTVDLSKVPAICSSTFSGIVHFAHY